VPVLTPVALAETLLRMLEVSGRWSFKMPSEYLMPLEKMKILKRTADDNECSIVGNSMLYIYGQWNQLRPIDRMLCQGMKVSIF
jgi:hypothetical protein